MKTISIKKVLIGLAVTIGLLAFVPMLTANQIFLNPVETDFVQELKEKLNNYYNTLPEDRVYVQTDKTLYRPGETIWLSTYLLDGKTLKASTKSEILHVELIAPGGNIAKKLSVVNKKGRSTNQIDLDKHVLGGQYTLRAYPNWQKNEKDTLFFSKKLTVQKVILPRIKMKLDFQREAFGPGDMCIAKIDLENNSNEVLANHAFEYQVKIKNKEFKRESAKTGNDGSMYIEFNLPKHLKTSDVILTALIPYQNQTESISRSVPVVLNDISIEFMPEGGDLVYNLPTKVAFRAFNETGKPVDVEGIVFDEDDNEVCTLKSFHFGMGAFSLTPKNNGNYYVQITKPVSIAKQFELPEIMSAGYVLNVENNNNDLAVTIQSSVSDHLHLVMQTRGKIIFSSEYDVAPGANRF
ncbi:MAG: hypothetical protein HKO56_04340, partial [Bacteroidia bacterium]|nr:hypothetical protein [Bacteroidia bacterium]